MHRSTNKKNKAVINSSACFNFLRAVVDDPTEEWDKGFESSIVYIYEYSDETEEFTLKQILRNLAEDVD